MHEAPLLPGLIVTDGAFSRAHAALQLEAARAISRSREHCAGLSESIAAPPRRPSGCLATSLAISSLGTTHRPGRHQAHTGRCAIPARSIAVMTSGTSAPCARTPAAPERSSSQQPAHLSQQLVADQGDLSPPRRRSPQRHSCRAVREWALR